MSQIGAPNRVISNSFRRLACLAVIAVATQIAPAQAAPLGGSSEAESGSSITFHTTPGAFTGKWAYRSIAISGDPKMTFAKMGLGSSEFDLVESGGKVTGTRPAPTKGQTYPVSGFVAYAPRRPPQIVLHSVSVVGGKNYEYDYLGYLMPNWNVPVAQPDTFMGTVVRTDPDSPDSPAVVVSFIATRENATVASEAKPGKPGAAVNQ